jgi:hypothetical protein
MFKHITPHPWHASNITVWGYQDQWGYPRVADCKSLSMPLATQRANARLIAIAPQMFEILRGLTNNEEAQAVVRYMEREDAHEDSTTE